MCPTGKYNIEDKSPYCGCIPVKSNSWVGGFAIGFMIFSFLVLVCLGFSVYVNVFFYKKQGYKSVGSLLSEVKENMLKSICVKKKKNKDKLKDEEQYLLGENNLLEY